MVSKIVIDTIIAEAGGDPKAMAAVAAVINNRAAKSGKTPAQIVKAPKQFEGYSNPGSKSQAAQQDAKVRARAVEAWNGITSGAIADPTDGGLMFHAASMTPNWAKSENKHGTVNIGGNVFYKGKGGNSASAAINDAFSPTPAPAPLAYASAPENIPLPQKRPEPGLQSLPPMPLDNRPMPTGVPQGYWNSRDTFQPGMMGRGQPNPDPAGLMSARGMPQPPSVPTRVAMSPAPGLTSRSVSSVPIGADGNPITGPSPMSRPSSFWKSVDPAGLMTASGSSGGSSGSYGSASLSAPNTGKRPLSEVAIIPDIPMSREPNAPDLQMLQPPVSGSIRASGLSATSQVPTRVSMSAPPIPAPMQVASIPGPDIAGNPSPWVRGDRLPSNANALAYDGSGQQGVPPGVAAIDGATMPPMPIPRPPTPTIYNGQVVDNSTPVVQQPGPSQQFRAAPPPPPPVRMGTAQGGRYQYVMQPDGSVLNVTTGRVYGGQGGSMPAPRSIPQIPQQRQRQTVSRAQNDLRESGMLDQFGMII